MQIQSGPAILKVVGGSAYNVFAGFWGSMGKDITVSGVTVDTCNDVGIDAESSINVVFSDFTVRNCKNGGLAVFFSSQQVEFKSGTVTSDTASRQLLWAHNASLDPTLATDIYIHNVKFACNDPSELCSLNIDPLGKFQFENNEVTNAVLHFVSTNNSGYRITGNRFSYTYTPQSFFSAIRVPGQVHNHLPTSEISCNIFQSKTIQKPRTYAIDATITDSNYSDILYIAGNVTNGFTTDAKFVADSDNRGITPTFIFDNNKWGSNSVEEITSGSQGNFFVSPSIARKQRSLPESQVTCSAGQAVNP